MVHSETLSKELVTMQVPFVDLEAQYQAIAPEVQRAINDVLQRTDYILGRAVDNFEREYAAYCEVEHAIGVSSGVAALELILRAYGIGPGDEVITVANTFIATALSISTVGATPVLVDADPHTYTIDVAQIEQAISPRTKALVPVHLYGQPADMDAVMQVAQKHGLIVVEDAAQAHGARYRGRRVGGLGHAAAFSFYPAKNLGAYGDGGMVVTNDGQLAETVRKFRNYGQRAKYYHELKGYNHRLDTLQAAVLGVKLPYMDAWNTVRRQNAGRYNELLADAPVILPREADYAEAVYHLYVVRVERREELQAYLRENSIATGIHYPVPVHLQEAYSDLGYQRGAFPVSERYADEILSLPMYAELTAAQVTFVAETLCSFVVAA
jgi:dTDP-4-amino-4,6-dideoxygalactose transaminase